jgi:hypothetical protein
LLVLIIISGFVFSPLRLLPVRDNKVEGADSGEEKNGIRKQTI